MKQRKPNDAKGSVLRAVAKRLSNGAEWTVPLLADATGCKRSSIRTTLTQYVSAGKAVRVREGVYRLLRT